MKRFLIIAILIFAMFFPPVSASGVYTEHATIGDNWVLGLDYNMSQSPTEICDLYGWTVYPGYTEKLYHVYFKDPAAVALAYGLVPAANFTSVATELHYPGNTSIVAINTNTYPSTALYAECNNAGSRESVGIIHALYNSSVYLPPPIANFTAAPLNAAAPAYIAFTDTSLNVSGTCTFNWTVDPVTNVTGATGMLRDHTALFNDVGLYTVSHSVSCMAGSDTEEKTDYINVTSSTGYITTAFRATDGATGNRITGATIHLNDVENGSWSNSSTNLGVATITVLQGHHISAYATALGFEDGEYLNAPAMAWTYDIMMLPTGFANVSAGNVTAYITVTDADTLQKLYGAQVNALYATGEGSFILESQTNSAGVASFVLPNNTNVHFTGVKSGYESSQLVLNTGTGSGGDAHVEGELKMSKLTVTPTITQTTLPGGGTPAPTQTYLRYCNPDASDYNEDACRTSENTGMMDQLREAGPSIIGLCIVAILMGLLKIIMG